MLRTLAYEPLRNVVASVENTVGGATVSRFGYTHDQVYRRTHTVFSGSAFAAAAFARYTHNDRAELTAADKFLGTDTTDETSPVPAYAYAYDFDPIGQPSEARRPTGTVGATIGSGNYRLTASDAETGTTVSKTYTPDQLNQYTAIVQPGTPPVTINPQHDADGNQTTLDNAEGNWTLLWNAENRLVEMTRTDLRIQFLYDYRGRRVEKRTFVRHAGIWAVSETRRFLYEGWTLVAEFTLDGASPVLDRTHLWGIDLSGSLEGAGGIGGLLRVAVHGAAPAVRYPAYDGNGNVTALVDATTGAAAASYEYDPFGNTLRATGEAAASPFRFSTKYLDPETRLLYYGYRYLDTGTGRWLNRDPIGEEGGVGLYVFVWNSSVGAGRVDPLGLTLFSAVRPPCGKWVLRHREKIPITDTIQIGYLGPTPTGFEVQFVPDTASSRACGRSEIRIIQAIKSSGMTGESAVFDAHTPEARIAQKKTGSVLPNSYTGGGGLKGWHGQWSYADGPYNPRTSLNTTFTIEVCAVCCQNGTNRLLGCASFGWRDKKRELKVGDAWKKVQTNAQEQNAGVLETWEAGSSVSGKVWQEALDWWNGLHTPK